MISVSSLETGLNPSQMRLKPWLNAKSWLSQKNLLNCPNEAAVGNISVYDLLRKKILA